MSGKLLLLAAVFFGFLTTTVAASAQGAPSGQRESLPIEAELPSLDGANAWLNSPPLSAHDLRGRVVVVQIWNYTCINWLRTLPYVRAWADKYKYQGLVVIGVHSPEFEFEKKVDNVDRATRDLQIDYPVAVDSYHLVWNAFNNTYWPALYIADAQGRIRYHHFGEGGYAESERVIQELLTEAGAREVSDRSVSVNPSGIELAADWLTLRSPETYLGYARADNFASAGGLVRDRSKAYANPQRLALNQWALSGDWTVGSQAAVATDADASITYRFHARDVNLVMGVSASPARFRVLVDGKPPGAAHGIDVDAEGYGTVGEPRLYQLIRQPAPIGDRRLEIQFLDAGAEIFSFTFG